MTDTWQAVFIITVSSVTLRKRVVAEKQAVTGNDYRLDCSSYLRDMKTESW